MHELVGRQAATKPSSRVNSPVAVILRTHLLNDKFYDLLAILSKSVRYDLYVGADETLGPLNLSGYKKLSHSTGLCYYFDLYTNHSNILWHCGDYALYFCAAQIPHYRYYIMIEYDVDLVRKTPLFLDQLVFRLGELGSPDFVSPSFQVASPEWCWTEAAAKQFPVVYTTGIFGFVVVSAKALDHLYERRKREALNCSSADDVVMCEAFCASALVEGGYACASINDLIDGAVDFGTFHPPMPTLEISQYLLNQYTIVDPKIEIVHPVYDLQSYLAKQFEKRKTLDELPRFLEELDGITTTEIWQSELIAEYREICLGKRSSVSEKVVPMSIFSIRPTVKRRKVAVVTDSMSPGFYFPLWYRYYGKQFGAQSIHVVTLDGLKGSFAEYDVASITEMEDSYDDNVRLAAVTERVSELMEENDYVIRVDSDEFLVPEPSKFRGLGDYVQALDEEYVTARGFDVFQHSSEPEIMLDYPILAHQRHHAFALTSMNKTCITSVPIKWNRGFHCCSLRPKMSNLFLFHLKRADITQQVKWNKFLSQRIRDDSYIRSYYETPEDKIVEFHTDFSNPARRQTVEGDDVLYRSDFTKQFIESVRFYDYTDLYEAPYVLEKVNVIIPERFRARL